MPLVLKPWQVCAVLGLKASGLRTLREANPDIVIRKCGKGMYEYSKAEIAKLAKLKFE
jgi:hypothetical protein